MKENITLYQKDAIARRTALTTNGTYAISYYLILIYHSRNKSPDSNFDGVVEINFSLDTINSSLFLDSQVQPQAIQINGVNSQINFSKGQIHLDHSLLKAGQKNSVVVSFRGKYNNDCSGLNHFTDPIDNREYTYTKFEPFHCNKVFPCFDQPDLKASLSLYVAHPSHWSAYSGTFEQSIRNLTKEVAAELAGIPFLNLTGLEDYALTIFSASPKISTYLFVMVVGEWFVKSEDTPYKVPLRIMKMQSEKGKGDYERFFELSKKCIEFYENYFETPFPFEKCDSAFCPEYKYGGMENVGLITYPAQYHDDNINPDLQLGIEITLFHELAHMWFGDLVTMVWWDDLWLNEAFATFISYYAHSEILPDKAERCWQNCSSRKTGGLFDDSKPSTYAVQSTVPDTVTGESIFGNIVYSKGMAILRQFFYFVGEKNFGKALADYFAEYKWSNTTFDDFIGKLANHYEGEADLKSIADNWLKKAGAVIIRPQITKLEGKIAEFKIIQTPYLEQFNNLQTILTDVLLIYKDRDELHERILIRPQEETVIESLAGLEAPLAIVPNYSDWSYHHWGVDDETFNYLLDNLQNLKNPVPRSAFLEILFERTRSAQIDTVKYVEVATNILKTEKSTQIIRNTFSYFTSIIQRYTTSELQGRSYKMVQSALEEMMWNNQEDADLLALLFKLYLGSLNTEEQVELLKDILKEEPFFQYEGKRVAVKEDMLKRREWYLYLIKVFTSNTISLEEKNEVADKVIRDDKSTSAVNCRIVCENSLPGKENKAKVYDIFVNNQTKYPYVVLQQIAGYFKNPLSTDDVEEFCCERWFEDVVEIGKTQGKFIVNDFVYGIGPGMFINEKTIGRMQSLVKETAEITALNRVLVGLLDNMEKAFKCHELLRNNY